MGLLVRGVQANDLTWQEVREAWAAGRRHDPEVCEFLREVGQEFGGRHTPITGDIAPLRSRYHDPDPPLESYQWSYTPTQPLQWAVADDAAEALRRAVAGYPR